MVKAIEFIGVQMGKVFALAKEFMEMQLDEIEKLLDSPIHEARTGAVSIMDFQARNKKTSERRRKELFDLYINRHDRINNWDLVDRSAPYVVGGYLFDKPRNILYKLARSKNMWERRTAIVSTFYFIRQNDLSDTFKIGEILVNDKQDLIQKATGGWLREAGKRDPLRLIEFLDEHAATMPRTDVALCNRTPFQKTAGLLSTPESSGCKKTLEKFYKIFFRSCNRLVTFSIFVTDRLLNNKRNETRCISGDSRPYEKRNYKYACPQVIES